MPYDDPDATDPMELQGVEIDVDGPQAVRDMAVCFIEEYLRLGLSAEGVYEIFTHGQFAGPTMALRRLGEPEIARLIAEQIRIRGPRGDRLPTEQRADGAVSLPVLET